MNYTILNRDELPRDGNTYEFEGSQYKDTEVSFIWVDMPPGGVVQLHRACPVNDRAAVPV